MEVLAVDDRCGVGAGCRRALAERRQLVVVGGAPGHVMDRARALHSTVDRWRLLEVEGVAIIARQAPFAEPLRGEPDRLEQTVAVVGTARVRAHTVEALKRELRRNVAGGGRQWFVLARD